MLVLVLMAGMAEGGGNTDSDGVGGGRDLVGAGDVELPTGSAKAFGTVAGGRRVGPRLAVSCVAVAVVVRLSSLSGAQPLSSGALHRGGVMCAR